MANHDLAKIKSDYERDGYVSGIELLNQSEANTHRERLERAETDFGNMHYKSKIHTLLTSPLELATMPAMLDIVEQMIGPDILLYNVTYIIKEANSPSHVSWHQDLTYWGLSHDDQVSAWLALSPATAESGCMRMIPGSHTDGVYDHETGEDETNVLLQSQTIRGIDESKSVMCPLKPGEASFHHGWTLHASMPNNSNDRRIGLNIQYLAAHVRQTKHDLDTAMLVRGKDDYNNFGIDLPAERDLDPVAIARQAELERMHVETAGTA
ncbi:MAG: phytanoyl-CoA dioxygenase family protein [Rhizobiaceae bacterium]|nr:phytanoyl-CoA dioxygenase family protein [Rhizobiaceae bacterium]